MEGIEEDPAAAFLAREQDELAGIADDTLGFTPEAPITNMDPTQVQEPDFLGGGGGGDMFGSEPPPPDNSEPVSYPPDPYAAVYHMDTTHGEPDCIKKWREEQTDMLSKKDQDEADALDALRNQAMTELQEWYSRHEDQLTQTKGSNRQAENAFVEERDEDIPGHEWERVARFCDFNPKNSKNTKDVGRMRSIFLQLKQTPLVRD